MSSITKHSTSLGLVVSKLAKSLTIQFSLHLYKLIKTVVAWVHFGKIHGIENMRHQVQRGTKKYSFLGVWVCASHFTLLLFLLSFFHLNYNKNLAHKYGTMANCLISRGGIHSPENTIRQEMGEQKKHAIRIHTLLILVFSMNLLGINTEVTRQHFMIKMK